MVKQTKDSNETLELSSSLNLYISVDKSTPPQFYIKLNPERLKTMFALFEGVIHFWYLKSIILVYIHPVSLPLQVLFHVHNKHYNLFISFLIPLNFPDFLVLPLLNLFFTLCEYWMKNGFLRLSFFIFNIQVHKYLQYNLQFLMLYNEFQHCSLWHITITKILQFSYLFLCKGNWWLWKIV